MILLNVWAAVCGGFIYWLLALRQRQSASQREKYSPDPFRSLAEASQSWRVYRQCGSKTDRDSHVCNFCGFTIRASCSEHAEHAGPELAEDIKADSKVKPGKKGAVKKSKNK